LCFVNHHSAWFDDTQKILVLGIFIHNAFEISRYRRERLCLFGAHCIEYEVEVMSHATVSYWSAMIRVEAEKFGSSKKVGAPEFCFVERLSHAARCMFLLDEVAPVLLAFFWVLCPVSIR
jgi:hypothetical protein